MSYYMGIDMGGTMVKAALFDENGYEIKTCGRKLTVLYPGRDMAERSCGEAKNAVYGVIADVLKETGISGAEVAGIGVTGQANGLYMLDADGEPVQDAILSSDVRAKHYVTKWTGDGTWERILPKIRQQIWAGNTPLLIRWMKDHRPEVLEKTRHLMTAKDYVRYLLTEDYCLEYTEASGIAMLDQQKRAFTTEITDAYGITEYLDRFPKRILESTEIGGVISKKAAELTGLADGTPVVGGQMDTGASIISTGITREDQLGIIVGSWGINSIVSNEAVVDPDIFMVYEYCLPGMYCVMEGSPTSATNQEWFIKRLTKDLDQSNIYSECAKLVADADMRDTVFFLPFLYGSNVSVDAKAAFIGLTGSHGRAEMLRALYEGVAFCHQYHIEKLKRYAEHVNVIRMAGGAARSKVWMQMFSDILGKPIEISQASELGAMGVAMEAAVGTGYFKDMAEAAEKWVRIKNSYEPDPEKNAFYKEKYHVYKRILEQLQPVWKEIDRLG